MELIDWQWLILILFGLIFLAIAPFSKGQASFFQASSKSGKSPNFLLLTSSLIISWIFAKSITNAANLGLEFGIVGGIAYAVYYLSFITVGLVIYQLRKRGNYKSIHHFLESKYGKSAVLVFSILIGIRLFNEVWSNTIVIGSYFGDQGSSSYFAAIVVFTALTLGYTIKGGMRSSLLTDAIQMILFGLMLFLLLTFILPSEPSKVIQYFQTGNWKLNAGVDLLLVALLQTLSYPFHDAVMTDRGFISSPKTTLRSYLAAGFIGFGLILLFSLIGVHAQQLGISGQAAVEVGKLLGVGAMLGMNFIMITSAASTLDSAFSSFSKLWVVDLKLGRNKPVQRGRIVMIIVAVAGTLPIFINPEILSATTISGTMVMGLAPVFVFWTVKSNKWSFHLPVLTGILFGVLLLFEGIPESWMVSEGKYSSLLAANLWGLPICIALFFISTLFNGKK